MTEAEQAQRELEAEIDRRAAEHIRNGTAPLWDAVRIARDEIMRRRQQARWKEIADVNERLKR